MSKNEDEVNVIAGFFYLAVSLAALFVVLFFTLGRTFQGSQKLQEDLDALEARARSGELVAFPFKGTKEEREDVVAKACMDIVYKWQLMDPRWNRRCQEEALGAMAAAERAERARKVAKEMDATEEVAAAALDEVDRRARAAALAAKKKADDEFEAKAKALADRIEAGQGRKAAGVRTK